MIGVAVAVALAEAIKIIRSFIWATEFSAVIFSIVAITTEATSVYVVEASGHSVRGLSNHCRVELGSDASDR